MQKESINIRRFLADNRLAEEISGEAEDCATRPDLRPFCGYLQVDVFAGLQGGAGEGDGLPVNESPGIAFSGFRYEGVFKFKGNGTADRFEVALIPHADGVGRAFANTDGILAVGNGDGNSGYGEPFGRMTTGSFEALCRYEL